VISRRELLAGAAAVAVVPAPVELSGQDLYASILGPYAEGIQVETFRSLASVDFADLAFGTVALWKDSDGKITELAPEDWQRGPASD